MRYMEKIKGKILEVINIASIWGIVIIVVVSATLYLINYFDRRNESIISCFNGRDNIYFDSDETTRIINKNNDWNYNNGCFQRGEEIVKISHTREWK